MLSSVLAGDHILPRQSLQMPTHEQQALPASEPSSLDGKTTTMTTTTSSTTPTTHEVRIPSALTGRLSTIEYADTDGARGVGARGAHETEGAWGANAGVESTTGTTRDAGMGIDGPGGVVDGAR